ncbi:hypothetical protein GB931_06120 [Modestobacter sp. I12A-02628]|uniref:DUF3093 domain-containing protein n=1 Tax=Goekera deserti TaxID=2497753 RepID=A0A7K3WCY8_9ACTN|nr:hypothetical protein [Goekera deserti]MPQ97505.1 hypothetical protein [Goekera deserti]NDI47892.1 hypothetical protein [Goekera deserti]NEL53640.1 hypothetical protein [Goekera deserti]
MARRRRRDTDEPPAVRAALQREQHRTQTTSYGYFARLGPKRSVTVTPPPLRYWQYVAASPGLVLLTVLAVAAWLGFLGWRDGSAALVEELPLALGLGVLVLVLATGRLTVSDHAVSTDVAGVRQTSPFGVVALVLVEDVVPGPPPAGWPRPRRRGGWWPGRSRVSVRHLDDDGVTDRCFTVWVRSPEDFADALGRPLD